MSCLQFSYEPAALVHRALGAWGGVPYFPIRRDACIMIICRSGTTQAESLRWRVYLFFTDFDEELKLTRLT